jgi:LDH2 family malate/lactate/ureidoglycolate dehydrogenase
MNGGVMSEKGTIDAGKLTEFTAKALQKVGVPEGDARVTARLLVATDLRGVDSHGVAHLANMYIPRIQKGEINPDPQIKVTSRAPSTAIMDADKALGFVAGHRAMNEAMDRAEKTGAGFVAVNNSTHFGAAAIYAVLALERDMIGISLTQGGRGMVAPGGKGKGIGLNVISIAIPAKEEAPFVLDMCTGVVAHGKLEIAKRNNKPIPEGWALDDDGNPATDPEKAAGILPLGGTPQLGAYKGFGLTVLVDILCSTLSGGLTIPEKKGGQANHFFGALRIDGFLPAEEFKERMDAMTKAHHELPAALGEDRICLPGEIEQRTAKERSQGIPLHPKVVATLRKLASDLDIEYDL